MIDVHTPTSEVRGPDPRPQDGPTRGAVLRRVLWLLLAAALVGDTAASFAGVPPVSDLGFAAVTAVCVAALLAHHLRGRR